MLPILILSLTTQDLDPDVCVCVCVFVSTHTHTLCLCLCELLSLLVCYLSQQLCYVCYESLFWDDVQRDEGTRRPFRWSVGFYGDVE